MANLQTLRLAISVNSLDWRQSRSRGYGLVMLRLYFSQSFFLGVFSLKHFEGNVNKAMRFFASWHFFEQVRPEALLLIWCWDEIEAIRMLHKVPRLHKTVCKWFKFQCQVLYKEELCPLPASRLCRIGDRSCWGAMWRHATEKATDLGSFGPFQCLQDAQGFRFMKVMQTLVCWSICHDLSGVSRLGTR